MNASPIIQTRSLAKTYLIGNVRIAALEDVSLSVDEGRFVAVTGASGSGKSTLLNLLGGLDTPSAGTIEVAGALVSAMDRDALAKYRRFGAGMIFQSFNLVPSRTALENVELPLVFSDVDKKERRRRAAELLDRVGLAHRAGHRPPELSGGEQQRVAVARALVNDPRLLLADEPTGNLDWKTGEKVLRLVLDLHERRGLSSILVTHNEKIARYCHKVYMMEAGELKLLSSLPS